MTLPLAGFDTETTGRDPLTDRIVSWAVVETDVGHIETTGLINPGIPIPQEATDVHGITNEDAAYGSPAAQGILEIGIELGNAWAGGLAIVGHNIVYDLTILDREMHRHIGAGLTIGGPVIDTLVIDKHMDAYRRGSRSLVATCRHYGIPLSEVGAHGAAADALAALRLAQRMLRGWSKGDLDQLHKDQAGWYADQQAGYARWARSKGVAAIQESGWPVRDAA